MTASKPPASSKLKLLKRGQIAAYIGAALFILAPVGSAGMTVVPMHVPSESELLHAELDEIVEARKARIVQLEATLGDRCDRFAAPEYAKLLVLDGRWADASRYATGYAERCGDDPNVRKWGTAPVPRVASIMKSLDRH